MSMLARSDEPKMNQVQMKSEFFRKIYQNMPEYPPALLGG
jgi:hypothetical protein